MMNFGLIYNYDENWIGGAYYIQNLVHAFKTLPDNLRPKLSVYSGNSENIEQLKAQTGYANIVTASEYSYSKFDNLVNRVTQKFLKRRIIRKEFKDQHIVFPVFEPGEANKSKMLFWIPDFQEHYLPEFFSAEEITRRISHQNTIAGLSGAKLLLSSHAALQDYQSFFPEAKTRNFVVPFAVTHPDYSDMDIQLLKHKYKVKGDYFISPNQFWAHKNHRVIIDAVSYLKTQGHDLKVLFTGKPHDWRNPEYYTHLLAYVETKKLNDNISFLGFIDRREQLSLMKHSLAVIQPSRFEGWSTVIEDAKAMNQFIIASDIDVHKEQLEVNGSFFSPDDPVQLAETMLSTSRKRPQIVRFDYKENVKKFALDFLEVIR